MLQQYYDEFIAAGVNQVAMLKDIESAQLESIVTLAGHRRKVQLAIDKLQGSSAKNKFDRLVFSVAPPDSCVVGEPIEPAIEVHAAPGTSEEVELILHGSPAPEVTGNTRIMLRPNAKAPSVATFTDISIEPVGEYLFEVRSVNNEAIFARAAKPTQVTLPRSRDAIEALFQDFDDLLTFA